MSTSFMFYMLLRDVYQHANADRGRLTNSRVFFVDDWTKWAVFVYGQDMHVPHHLFPAIPHYRLPALHEYLKTNHREYSEHVVECRGTLANEGQGPTILDVLTTINPSDAEVHHHSAHPAPRPSRSAISKVKSFTTRND
jgi:hypothetical protein